MKLSKILAVIVVLALSLAGCNGSKGSDNNNGGGNFTKAINFQYVYDAALDGVEITNYIGNDTTVRIPEKINGDTVKRISGFGRNNKVVSVTIPNTVTTIGDTAFQGCVNLRNVTIPDSVTSIGEWAFSNCMSLTEITIPNGVTAISGFMFSGSGLTSITIHDNITSIGTFAFANCESLRSLTLPDSVEKIYGEAFDSCKGLTVTYKGETYNHETFNNLYNYDFFIGQEIVKENVAE